MADNTISFVVGGARYDVCLDDLTAADAGDFRRAVGIPLVSAFSDGKADLDVIAGMVWLIRRRGQRNLAYASVAETITYGNVSQVDDEQPAEAADGNDPHSPEA